MGSHETYLTIVNNTAGRIIRILVDQIDSFDWDGGSRPDNNFQNIYIEPQDRRRQREELNSNARSANFRMSVQFENGETITFSGDQYDARNGARRTLSLSGVSADKYLVLQTAGGGQNTISIIKKIATADWMAQARGGLTLAQLNLPGTHDTGTFTCDDGLISSVGKTQTMSLRDQLQAGVRYLDIRCNHDGNTFKLFHGILDLQQGFDKDVRDVCYEFLRQHPSETIVMSLKQETGNDSLDAPSGVINGNCRRFFEETFRASIFETEAYWYLGNRVPTLDEVRGKIVLLRRFSAANTLGIDGTRWPDNEYTALAESSDPNAVTLSLQDKYFCGVTQEKWQLVKQKIEDAQRSVSPQTWCLNYSSCMAAPDFSWNTLVQTKMPRDMAVGNADQTGVNSLMFDYLVDKLPGRFGTVIMDFPESPEGGALIRKLIALNFLDAPARQFSPISLPPAAPRGVDGTAQLSAGQYLAPGQYLLSPNGRFKLVYDERYGSLAFYEKFEERWLMRGAVAKLFAPWRLGMQDDGNLVIYRSPGRACWASADESGLTGAGHGLGGTLRVRDSGQVEVRAADETLLWSMAMQPSINQPPPPPAPVPVEILPPGRPADSSVIMLAGQYLLPGQSLQSSDGRFRLRYQTDGNLVLYAQDGSVVWTTNTPGQSACQLYLKTDGNLIVFANPTTAIWKSSNLGGNCGPQYSAGYLRVQNDGNLEVRAQNGNILWTTGTGTPPSFAAAPIVEPTPISVNANAKSLALPSGYLKLPKLSSLGYVNGVNVGFSVETWVRFNRLRPMMRIFDFGNEGGNSAVYLGLCTDTSALVLDAYDPNLSRVMSYSGVIQIDDWMHLCVTVNSSGQATVYKNGIVVMQGALRVPNVERLSNFIGHSNWSADPAMDAAMSEFRIWNSVLDQNTIQARMAQRLRGDEPGLLGYYRLDDGTAFAAAKDCSVNSPIGDAQFFGPCAWLEWGPMLAPPAAVAIQPPAAPPVNVPPPSPPPEPPPVIVPLGQNAPVSGLATAPSASPLRQTLMPGQMLQSPNGKYKLILQTDGNLVLYADDGRTLWSSNTGGSAPGGLAISDTGSLVLTDSSGAALWSASTGTSAPPPVVTPPVVTPPVVTPPVVTPPAAAAGSIALTGGYAKLPNIASLGFGTPAAPQSGFSVETWVLFNAPTPWARVFDLGASPGTDTIALIVGRTPSGLLVETISAPNPRVFFGPADCIQPGIWMHLCLTVDQQGNAVLYKDGAPLAQGQIAFSDVVRDSNLIGKSNNPRDPMLDCSIAEVRIWGLVRQSSDILANRYQGLAGNESGLLGYWKFNDGNGAGSAKDYCTNGPGGQPLIGAAQLIGAYAWSSSAPPASAPAVTPPPVVQPPPPVMPPPPPVMPPPPPVMPPPPPVMPPPPPVVPPPVSSGPVTPFIQSLQPSQALQSPNGAFVLVLRDDGTIAVCAADGGVLWTVNSAQP